MSRDSSDNNQNLPLWLRNVPLPPRPASADVPVDPSSDQLAAFVPDDDQTPDWLRDLSSTSSSDPGVSHTLPNWLGSDESASTASTAAGESVPDWLRVQSNEPALPDWLNDVTTDPARTPADDVPDWLRASTDPAQAVPDESPVPNWLDETVKPQSNELPISDTLPDQPPIRAPTVPVLNSWFDDPPAMPPASFAEPSAGDDDVPDWLRDIPMDEVRQVMSDEDPEASITATPFTFEGADAPRAAPSGEVPSWLGTIANDTSAENAPSWLDTLTTPDASEAPNAATSPVDVPEWLRGVRPPVDLPPPPAAASTTEVPDWLRDIEQGAPTSQDVPVWLQEATGAPPAVPELPTDLSDAPTAAAPTVPLPAANVPDWLRPATPAPLPPPDDDVPAWLREAAPTTAPDAPPPDDDDIPAWLRDASSETPASSTQDVPDWLRPVVSVETPSPSPVEDVPDWMGADTAATSTADTPSGADLPAWLRAEAPPDVSTPSASPPAEVPLVEDLPPWLRDEAGAPLPTAADASLPAWLRGAPTNEPPASPLETVTLPPAPTPIEAVEPPRRAEPAPVESEFLGGTDLPAWLRPQEADKSTPIDAESARSLNWLTRISPADEEPMATEEVAEVSQLALPQQPTRTVAHGQALSLLERLVAEPFPEAAPLPDAAPASVWQRVGIDRALYVLLLVTLIAALLVPSLVASLQAAPIVPNAPPLFQRLDTLTNQDVVLVGYEWDARRVGELRPLQDAVLGHLISKGVKLVLVSTDPQGTLLSYDLRYTLAANGYNPGGSDYILLGYKPGGELALRQLARNLPSVLASDFQGNDANIGGLANGIGTQRPLRSLSDFAAILVLADDPVDVQGWMEQVHRGAPGVPIAFMLPEETAPITQPYMRQPNVFSLAGKAGALSYENQRGADAARAATLLQESGQQRLGLLVFVVLFVVGALVVGATNALERRRKR